MKPVAAAMKTKKKTKPVYDAQSPDELALINGASLFGFNFVGRDAMKEGLH